MTRIELVTSSLPRKRSTPELHRLVNTLKHKNHTLKYQNKRREHTYFQKTILNSFFSKPKEYPGYSRAGDEGRTRDIQLGRLTLYQLSYSRIITVINHPSK